MLGFSDQQKDNKLIFPRRFTLEPADWLSTRHRHIKMCILVLCAKETEAER